MNILEFLIIFNPNSARQDPKSFISHTQRRIEMFYLNSTLNFGIPPVVLFQLEIYKLDILLTGITAQQKGTTARWYLRGDLN